MPSPHPQPGDKIQIFRTGYQHWAIYIGDGDVIHLTSDGACVAVAFGYCCAGSIAVIKREPLAKVIGNTRWHINNNSDRNWTPFPPDEIVERATSRIGERMCYKVLGANCEHFVNSVRYGINLAPQVEFAVGGACGVIAGGGLSVLAVPAAAATPVIVAVAGVASVAGHFGFQRILSRWLSR
uniref:Retinoic acid receptor responder protein 3 2 isoform 5 n=1 Tax=Potamotrygon motoro TaxID=86373 RepID=A0A5J6SD67_POTMO|nr:retinoic acid receptor responder protein 3 2 isoform 5 [Potamotrygon motoro]